MTKLDSQQIELVGRAALEAELIRNGYEVAQPARDRGIDLIAYQDEPDMQFSAVPIQMKVSSKESFGVYQKYEKFNQLVLVHIWNVLDKPRFFIIPYEETIQFVPDLDGKSWQENKLYTWTRTPKRIQEQLIKYENNWGVFKEIMRCQH